MSERVVITLDDFEHRLMIGGLNSFRNGLIQDDKPTDDIDDLILKVVDAPTLKERRRSLRETR